MYLEKIDSPKDLRALDRSALKILCKELRDYMVECCSSNPGHLGSSLGAVELIVGLHYVYDTPNDKIVFDVSHQSYAHKILTGRREAFRNIRKDGGPSGFARRDESPYDTFGGGHSSTSISAALGFAKAATLAGRDEKVVALIGDGALTGGEAYEGLNNLGASKDNVLVILNDNDYSIERNVGGMHDYLFRITSDRFYNRIKTRVWNSVGEGRLRRQISGLTRWMKSFMQRSRSGAVFESLGFRYFGPIDGNDIYAVTEALSRLHDLKGPIILHAVTRKGKGYAPAEEDKVTWHAPGAFDPKTGVRLKTSNGIDRFQDVFGQTLLELARADDHIVGVTPAMAQGCGMNLLEKEMPERFFDTGIAEQHAVTFSASLAAGGFKPFCNIYSAFAQRAYDQIVVDVALQRLPVVLCLDRAGLVGEDGATHNGAFDISFTRSIPNLIVACPSDELELREMMYSASLEMEHPYIIRYPRGYGSGVKWRDVPFRRIAAGKSRIMSGEDSPRLALAVLCLGPCVHTALDAVGERDSVCVVDMRFARPLDRKILCSLYEKGVRGFVTMEDGSIEGGLFSAVSEWVCTSAPGCRVIPLGIGDDFVQHAPLSLQKEHCGLTKEAVRQAVDDLIGETAENFQ